MADMQVPVDVRTRLQDCLQKQEVRMVGKGGSLETELRSIGGDGEVYVVLFNISWVPKKYGGYEEEPSALWKLFDHLRSYNSGKTGGSQACYVMVRVLQQLRRFN